MNQSKLIPCAVFGASGYSGVELVWLLHNHPQFNVAYGFTSSARPAEPIAALYPQLAGRCDLILQPWHPNLLGAVAQQVRVAFLALPHQASAELAPLLIKAGMTVFDLSGAFRLQDAKQHQAAYGFKQPHLAQPVPYGLAEWVDLQGDEPLIAVPGCYPTAAATALMPVRTMLKPDSAPIVNAISGVSGAGRAAQAHTSFCEVSLQAYAIGTHRHQAEMAQTLGCELLFVPHLGSFKRGILATVYAQLATGVSAHQVQQAFHQAYADQPLVRICQTPPKLAQVVGTPYVDVHVTVIGSQLVVSVALDNLQKGAAAQAVQLANQYIGLPTECGLLHAGAVI